VHFREILSGYFLFSRFDWSIFVTKLVAKHMKEIIKIGTQNKDQRENYLNLIVKLIKHIEIGLLARPPQEPTHVLGTSKAMCKTLIIVFYHNNYFSSNNIQFYSLK
jgi:CO dehydrogenase/acetyl-CoA synthase epsilon subunit